MTRTCQIRDTERNNIDLRYILFIRYERKLQFNVYDESLQ